MRWLGFFWVLYLVLFIGAALLLAGRASAAPCMPWPEMQSGLTNLYGEAPIFVGRSKTLGQEVAVYGAPQGTWSLVVRQANGLGCLLGAGHTWAMLDPTLTLPPNGTEN